jgi:hypothetical protein
MTPTVLSTLKQGSAHAGKLTWLFENSVVTVDVIR